VEARDVTVVIKPRFVKDIDDPKTHDDPAPESGWRPVLGHPAFDPYRRLLQRNAPDRLPTVAELNDLLPADARTGSGHPVRFVAAERLDLPREEAAYEREIHASGRVSTRIGRHDACNALVWARFPRLKATLNERHLAALPDSRPGHRGPIRDALTLFDECGGVAVSPHREDLERLAAHDWAALFGAAGEAWPSRLRVLVVGHGTLAKLWWPYKAMTGHCMLLHADLDPDNHDGLDALLARLWRPEGPIQHRTGLCPLPFMGIPGWWPGGTDVAFYADTRVFRAPRPGRVTPPVYSEAS
jgi:hypothetical protein